jgi:hypothetical protein
MMLAAVLIHALPAALEDAEIAFHRVAVDRAVLVICAEFGVACTAPTLPARRPIKPAYIEAPVVFIDAVRRAGS